MKCQVGNLKLMFSFLSMTLQGHLPRRISYEVGGMDLRCDYVALTPCGRAYKVISATNAWDSCINQHVCSHLVQLYQWNPLM